jgi:hypothetical protein
VLAAVDLEAVADANPTLVQHAVQIALDYAGYLPVVPIDRD